MSVHAAMEWLLTHPEAEPTAPDTEDTTSPAHSPDDDQSAPVFSEAASSPTTPDADVRPKTTTSGPGQGAVSPQKSRNNSVRKQSKAQTILESFRAYKRRKFKPNLVVSEY